MTEQSKTTERMADCPSCGGVRYFNLTHQCSTGVTSIAAGPMHNLVACPIPLDGWHGFVPREKKDD